MAEELTQAQANEMFAYDDQTGSLTWRVGRGQRVRAGDEAGYSHPSGYLAIKVFQKQYLAHRIIWLMKFGAYPILDIDHVNRNRADNRLSNLRIATRAQNCQNVTIGKANTSGAKGVCWHKQSGKWDAQASILGVRKSVGRFKNFDDAVAARCAAEKSYYTHSPMNGGV